MKKYGSTLQTVTKKFSYSIVSESLIQDLLDEISVA